MSGGGLFTATALLLAVLGCYGSINVGKTPDDAGSASCGDNVCASSETCATCAVDCGACSTHSVDLAWMPSTTANVTYNVYRGTATGGPYGSLMSGLTTTSTTDNAVNAATSYFYVVRAANSVGESDNSNEIEATIP